MSRPSLPSLPFLPFPEQVHYILHSCVELLLSRGPPSFTDKVVDCLVPVVGSFDLLFYVLFNAPHAMLLSSTREHLLKSGDDTLVTVGDHNVLRLVHNLFEDLHRLIIAAQ